MRCAASATAAAVFATCACAQAAAGASDWPKGPVTFVVPFSPGGGGDTIARSFAAPLAAALRSTVVVENRPGAGGNVGTASVARVPADGNTIVFGTMGTMGTNHALYRKTGYSIDDFEPVALLGSTALVLVVGPNASTRTVQDLVARGHRHPGQLSCASGGNGTVSHLACALLQQMAGIVVSHVPYKSSSAAYIDLMEDRVTFMIDVMPPLAPHLGGGRLRAVAVSTAQRIPALPDTPTIAETVPGYEIASWDGLFAPRGTPVDRLDRLHAAVNVVLGDAELVKSMRGRGYTPAQLPRKDFAEFVRREHVRMGTLVRKMGISLD